MEKLRQLVKFIGKPKGLFLILASLVVAGFIGRKIFGGQGRPPEYQTAEVVRGTIVASVSASGQVVAANLVTVSTQASGLVKSVLVKNGDSVGPGQPLMEIELDETGSLKKTQAWASYLAAQSGFETAKQNKILAQAALESDRAKLLSAQMSAAGTDGWDPTDKNKQKIDIDRRYAELNFQVAQQKSASADLSIQKNQADLYAAWLAYQRVSPVVTAPRSGIVSDLVLAPGMVVGSPLASDTASSAGQKVVVVKSQGSPIVSLEIAEVDVHKVQVGQKATVIFDSLPSKSFTGTVVGLDRTGLVSSGVTSYPATVKLDTTDESLLPNLAASTNILVEVRDNVLFLPSQAIQTTGGQTTVRKLQDGQVQQVSVETGISSDSETEIISGLAEGDVVVVGTVTASQSRSASPFGLPFGGTSGGFGGPPAGGLRPGGFMGSRR